MDIMETTKHEVFHTSWQILLSQQLLQFHLLFSCCAIERERKLLILFHCLSQTTSLRTPFQQKLGVWSTFIHGQAFAVWMAKGWSNVQLPFQTLQYMLYTFVYDVTQKGSNLNGNPILIWHWLICSWRYLL